MQCKLNLMTGIMVVLTLICITTKTLAEPVKLRSEGATVSEKDVQQVFGLKEDNTTYPFTVGRPQKYIEHQYEDRGEVVVDHATGLMWQKSGAPHYMEYQQAQVYIEQLNQQQFAGHSDWRLPTIPELISLFEAKQQPNELFINPIFDKTQLWCWSADRLPDGEGGASEDAWVVNFRLDFVHGDSYSNGHFVRGVRSEPMPNSTTAATPAPFSKPTLPLRRETPVSVSSRLRSEPVTVSKNDAQRVFGLKSYTYSTHQYETQGEVVIDHATGLMWQKSGSSYMNYEDAQAYIEQLNQQQFAGYSDWRLPTIPELMSLLEAERQSNKLFINPIFETLEEFYWVWTSDRLPASEGGSSGAAWLITFDSGAVHAGDLNCYVRGVR